MVEMPVEHLIRFTTTLLSPAQITVVLKSMERQLNSEGLDFVRVDFDEVKRTWDGFAEINNKMEATLHEKIEELYHNVSAHDVKETLRLYLENEKKRQAPVELIDIWHPLLRTLKSFVDRGVLAVNLMVSVLGTWNRIRSELIVVYQNLEKSCSKFLQLIRPVNLDKLIALMAKYQGNTTKFSGKEVVALCGPTGVGKSTLIHILHGATFQEETLFGALRSHLKPVYTDADKALDVTLSKVVTNPFGESETIEINATEISYGNMKLFVLDTPGMGDSNGCELDIVNGLNISSALRACASVRLVLVLSDLCLGDRMNSDTTIMKDCSRTAMDMVVSSEHVTHFSYVFTKMKREQSLTISSTFNLSANKLSGVDVDIRLFGHTLLRRPKPRRC